MTSKNLRTKREFLCDNQKSADNFGCPHYVYRLHYDTGNGLHSISDCRNDNIGAPLDAIERRVEAEVIALRCAPLLETIVVIVGSPLALRGGHKVAALLLALVEAAAQAFHPILLRGGDKHTHHPLVVAQHIVGTSAHEDTRPLLGQVLNGATLNLEESVVVDITRSGDGAETPSAHTERCGIASVFVGLLKEGLIKSALACSLGDNLLIVDGHPESAAQLLGQQSASCTELATYSYHKMSLHSNIYGILVICFFSFLSTCAEHLLALNALEAYRGGVLLELPHQTHHKHRSHNRGNGIRDGKSHPHALNVEEEWHHNKAGYQEEHLA